jgi:subtilisin family serine protease
MLSGCGLDPSGGSVDANDRPKGASTTERSNAKNGVEPQGPGPARVVIQFRRDAAPAARSAALRPHRAYVDKVIPQLHMHVLRVPPGKRAAELVEAYRDHPLVEFVEVDRPGRTALIPNDPWYDRSLTPEWHLPQISAPAAWDVTTGSPDVVIAIIDSGVFSAHEDLASKMVSGWNVYRDNADTSDNTGHGTLVAGGAAAASNNGIGVASVAWGSRLMPVVVTENGWSNGSYLAAGLVWAADHGAAVANMSFEMIGSQTLSSGAQYFCERGGVVVQGAGNSATVDPSTNDPSILKVSGTSYGDALWTSTVTGASIDLAAPAVQIVAPNVTGSYSLATGTSMAAPIVAGVAALVMSANPGLGSAEVQQALIDSADDFGPTGWDSGYGWGRVNAARAVELARDGGTRDTTPPTAHIVQPEDGEIVSASIRVVVQAADDTGIARVDLHLDGALVSSDTLAPHEWPIDTTALFDGPHTLRATAFDAAGNSASSQTVQAIVDNAECAQSGDCDDSNACTLDTCLSGQCVRAAVGCNDNDVCTIERCDPAVGCMHDAVTCDDADPRTVDRCDAVVGCVYTPVDCDDGNACTVDEVASDGGCRYGALDCGDGDACTIDRCDPSAGCRSDPQVCPDGESCADGLCLPPVCNADGVCDEGEDCNNCAEDCPGVEGAVCGNGRCDAGNGEDCLVCPDDCAGEQNGRPDGRFCCGAGGGERPVGCNDTRCNRSGFACVESTVPASCCGDGFCEGAETNCDCAVDCGPVEETEDAGTTCRDAVDNDCDGASDCDDSDCADDPLCIECDHDGLCEPGEGFHNCRSDCPRRIQAARNTQVYESSIWTPTPAGQ